MHLKQAIEESIEALVKEYNDEKNKELFMTESDVVCRLYHVLFENSNLDRTRIHSEIRPFTEENGYTLVITGKSNYRWDKQLEHEANKGCIIDLVLVDPKPNYFQMALRKAKRDQDVVDADDLKYWRVLSYPVESFKAAIEIKIKVHANEGRLSKDVKKLKAIEEKNPNCLLYFVILDRRAKQSKLNSYQKMRDGKIKYYTSKGLSQDRADKSY
jgi:hypothetical protein